MPPGFAATAEGRRLARLHFNGCPLAATAGDLTTVQMEFLDSALTRDEPPSQQPPAEDLRAEYERRLNSRGGD